MADTPIYTPEELKSFKAYDATSSQFTPQEIESFKQYDSHIANENSVAEAAANGGIGAGFASLAAKGIKSIPLFKNKGVEEPQVEPQVAPQAAPVVETPIAPIDIPPVSNTGTSGSPYGFGEGAVANAEHNVDQIVGNKVHQNFIGDPNFKVGNNLKIATPSGFDTEAYIKAQHEKPAIDLHKGRVQAAANEAALQNEARMTTQLKAAKAAKDAEAASLSGKIKAVTTPIKNAANTVANIPGVKQAGKAAQWVSDLPVIGHALAGAGVAGEAQDAYNRFQNDDYLGGTVSGLGALGSAASVFPAQPPWLRGAEAGLGMGAPLLNTGIDYVKKKFAEGGEVGPAPSEGGINYRDYPNPYQNPNINGGGLRAYLKSDGTYGGEMIPKSTGLLGELQGTGPNAGKSMTEYSIGDETGDYPSLVPTLNSEDIKNVLNGNITPEVAKKAREWSDTRKSHGMSPFYNPPGFAEGGEVDTTLPPVSVTAKKPSPEEMRQYLATHDENTGEQKDAIKDYLSGKSNLSEAFTQAGKELSNFPKSNGPAKAPSYSDPDIQEALNWAPMGIGSVGKVRKLSEALAPHEDKYLGLTQSDNYGIHEGRMGGNRFPALQHEIPKQADDSVVWMNDTENHANAMADNSTFNGKPTVWSTYIGGPDQLKSNKSVFQEILDSHYGRDLSPEQYQKLNDRIASLTTGSGKDKRLVFPQAFDIRDKFATQELGADTFARRGALADMIGMGEGVGKTKSGIILPNYQNILNENRDPLTEGVGTSSIGSRLFTVDPKLSQYSPGVYHPDYEWPVYGEDLNTPFNFTPHSVLDWYDRQFNKVNKAGKTGVVPHGNSWFNYMKNPQYIDDKFLTKLQKHGYAEGGPVDSTLPPVSVSAPRPSQSEMKAYLATHDENTGAPKDALGDFFSGRTNLSQALSQAGHELTHFPKSTTPNKVPSLDDPAVQAAMAFAPMGLGVVKNPGGTWLPDVVNEITGDAKARLAHTPAAKSVKNWYDTVLNKYVQNRMGSPSDEIRKLADQGISHIPASRLEAAHANIGPDRIVKSARKTSGFPEEGLATSPLGKLWEDVSDSQIESKPRKFISSDAASEMPGIEKLSPEDLVHYNSGLNPENLGFKHIGDMLQSDINAGKLTPEQLAQMSVEKAVRRTQNFNKTQAQAQETAQQSLPTVKDYPTGFTWKELTHQDPATLDAILKKEGETMQNCIGGYCSDVLEDGTKLYSLRDPAGNPHANVEVRPGYEGPEVKQIKGKQNEAPNETYQPYVQDFIKNPVGGQNFSVVGDLENSGLLDINRLKQHGLMSNFDQASQDVVNREIGRIHPKQPGKFGGFESSGQYGSYVPNYDLLKNLTQDFAGNYATPSDLMSHLQGKEARPVEESYSNFYDQPK